MTQSLFIRFSLSFTNKKHLFKCYEQVIGLNSTIYHSIEYTLVWTEVNQLTSEI